MRFKKSFIYFLVVVFLVVLIITSCSNRENDIIGEIQEEKKHELISEENLASEKPIYQDESIKVVYLKKLEQPSFINSELTDFSEKEVFERTDVIIKGKVSNIQEIAIEYEYYGAAQVEYETIFDFEITEVFYDFENILHVGDMVKMIISNSSYAYEDKITEIKTIDEYIFFCKSLSKLNDKVLKLDQYADYAINISSKGIFSKNNDYYETSKLFVADYPYVMSMVDLLEQKNSSDGDVSLIDNIQNEEFSIPKQYNNVESLNDFNDNYDIGQNITFDHFYSENTLYEKLQYTYIIDIDSLERIINDKISIYLRGENIE